MTQEEKQLLLRDLCARFPYGVICCVTHRKNGELVKEDMKLSGIFEDGNFYFLDKMGSTYSDNYIPYLRPMSSMTEEEKKFLSSMASHSSNCIHRFFSHSSEWYYDIHNEVDWLNAHHFDYRGLISKGLAIEAPSNMYNN